MKTTVTRWLLAIAAPLALHCADADGDAGSGQHSMPVWASPAQTAPMMERESNAGPVAPMAAGPTQAPPSPVAPSPGPGSNMGPGMDAGAQPMGPVHDSGDGASMDPGTCDRACLISFMQGYIDALMARDPSQLPVSDSLKYTENGVLSELGETVWQSAMALTPDTRLDFADPVEGQVASHFAFEETDGTAVIYQVRLKVEAGAISEIETMAVRRAGAANGFFNVANMKPEPVFLQAVEPAQRASREELIAVTEMYLDYLEGERTGREVPFGEGCKRYENGQVTASGISAFNAQSFWRFNVTRRILVVDEEAGITWGMFPFEQTATALVVGEAFKIFDGEIKMIQAVMANQPTRAWD